MTVSCRTELNQSQKTGASFRSHVWMQRPKDLGHLLLLFQYIIRIRSRTAGTQISAHNECQNCRWMLNSLCFHLPLFQLTVGRYSKWPGGIYVSMSFLTHLKLTVAPPIAKSKSGPQMKRSLIQIHTLDIFHHNKGSKFSHWKTQNCRFVFFPLSAMLMPGLAFC